MAINLQGLIDINLLTYFKSKLDLLLANKIDKEAGKGLSTNEGYDSLSSVTISAVTLQNKSATPNDTTQTLTADSGYLGLSTVTVNPVPNTYISRSEVITYYVDTADPTSADGSDGDIWLQTGGS